MHPVLIRIGPFTIYSYGFFIAAAILLGLAIGMREAKHRGLAHRMVPDLGFYIILSAIVGARLLYVLLKPNYFLQHPLDILLFWKGGLVFVGGAIGAVGAAIIYLRSHGEPFWAWADAFAPGIAAGQAVGRIGCLMAGCCYGKTCDLPWAVSFTNPNSLAPLHIPLHPTQIYHSLAGVLTLALLYGFKQRLKGSGQLFGLLLMAYGVLRFSIELLRGDFRGHLGPLSVTQWVALGVLGLGIALFQIRKRA